MRRRRCEWSLASGPPGSATKLTAEQVCGRECCIESPAVCFPPNSTHFAAELATHNQLPERIMTNHHCFIIPPHMQEALAAHADANVRRAALANLQEDSRLRGGREVRRAAPQLFGIPSIAGSKERSIYDGKGGASLPGTLLRAENGAPTPSDVPATEAFDYSGITYDFYREVFQRNSLDDAGLAMLSTVRHRTNYNNAFWNGEQMAYGTGDGVVFGSFTSSLDVVAHELSHGLVAYTANLEYRNESGALNEHFADTFGQIVCQWHRKQMPSTASWLVGQELIAHPGTRPKTRALRAFDNSPAYVDDPYLGTDPQPKHYSKKYTGAADGGGVHINSGIPNHAFYLFARALNRTVSTDAARIWYATVLRLKPTSHFKDMRDTTVAVAGEIFGATSQEKSKLVDAWAAVGL